MHHATTFQSQSFVIRSTRFALQLKLVRRMKPDEFLQIEWNILAVFDSLLGNDARREAL